MGRKPDGAQARTERLIIRTTPAALEAVTAVLGEGETVSAFVREAIRKEVAHRGRGLVR